MSTLDELKIVVYGLIVQGMKEFILDVTGIDRGVVKTTLDSLILRNEIKRVRSQNYPKRALHMLSDLFPSFQLATD